MSDQIIFEERCRSKDIFSERDPNKVFCNECVHKDTRYYSADLADCYHPNYFKMESVPDTVLEQGYHTLVRYRCSELNQKNDCEGFTPEPKEEKKRTLFQKIFGY